MTITQKMTWTWILQIGLFISLSIILEPIDFFYFSLAYFFVYMLFMFVSNRVAFVLFIAGSLLFVFYFLMRAFIEDWSTGTQFMALSFHFLIAVNGFVIYMSAYYFKKITKENERLNGKVHELERYFMDTELLTKQEFQKRAELIITSMKRRNESGYFVKINVGRLGEFIRESAMLTLAEISLRTVRDQYDLVGKWDNNTLIMLLQNTNQDGLDTVLERWRDNAGDYLEADMINHIRIEYIEKDNIRMDIEHILPDSEEKVFT
jgi:hypothetical protein